MMQVTMDLDPALEKRLAGIENAQKQTLELLRSLKGQMTEEERDPEWMVAPQFCRRWQISRSTLQRRVETGAILTFDIGGSRRYKWKEGETS